MEPPSKKFKPYSFLHPDLKRRHDEDDDDEEERHKKIMHVLSPSEAGRMAIRRANVLQVLIDLGILTVHRRPTPQEIDDAFNTYIQRYPNDRYITHDEFYDIAITSNISNGGRRKKHVYSSTKRSRSKKRSISMKNK